MLDAAARLLVDGGPAALSASGVARALGAPSGSVYHRFASRDHLAASLWMRTVERFDAEVVDGLRAPGDPLEIAVAAARHLVAWSAANPTDAFILTMFRREDLAGDDVPPDVAARARALGERQRDAIEQLARRLDQPADLVSFAVAGISHAAVRRHIGDRSPIPGWTADAVERSVRAVLSEP
jgi:AcrR family transcriptional regulator